jgi:hypothetical protein
MFRAKRAFSGSMFAFGLHRESTRYEGRGICGGTGRAADTLPIRTTRLVELSSARVKLTSRRSPFRRMLRPRHETREKKEPAHTAIWCMPLLCLCWSIKVRLTNQERETSMLLVLRSGMQLTGDRLAPDCFCRSVGVYNYSRAFQELIFPLWCALNSNWVQWKSEIEKRAKVCDAVTRTVEPSIFTVSTCTCVEYRREILQRLKVYASPQVKGKHELFPETRTFGGKKTVSRSFSPGRPLIFSALRLFRCSISHHFNQLC